LLLAAVLGGVSLTSTRIEGDPQAAQLGLPLDWTVGDDIFAAPAVDVPREGDGAVAAWFAPDSPMIVLSADTLDVLLNIDDESVAEEAEQPIVLAELDPLPSRPASNAAFRLPVPFQSQKDGSRYQGSNCGPAALAMVLGAHGMFEGNDDLRFLTHMYQGTVGRRGGTALQHMATVGGDFGLVPVGLYAGEDFHRWTVDEIRAQVEAGSPVVPLVKYRLLPGNEGSGVRYDHYIVLHGVQGGRFLYHDPAHALAEDGAARWITAAQLEAAITNASIPRQAVAFAGGHFGRLPALPL
jgi:hypothetical protein